VRSSAGPARRRGCGCGRGRLPSSPALIADHLLGDGQAHAISVAAPPPRRCGLEAAAHLVLDVLVEVADRAMLARLSMACSTSGGTETFSTMKLAISRPYLLPTTGLISGRRASPSSV